MQDGILVNKIHNSKGATILIALLFFLLCAMAGSVVLAAGTAASGRLAGLTGQQQTYYTVSSAARLLRDEMNDQKMEFSYSAESPDKTTLSLADFRASIIYNSEPDGELKNLMEQMVLSMYKAKKSATAPTEITADTKITANMTIAPDTTSTNLDKIEPVTVECTMDKNYNFTLQLHLEDYNASSYACTLTIPCVIQKEAVNEQRATGSITTTSLAWNHAMITK